MELATGSRLGPFEIVSRIGAGGMGEVFRARDTKLGREVAIKVLPAAFASDSERVARFRREAQVLASLHHPNIAAIFGLEELNGTIALVLELVEGEDLSERLLRGAIPVDESIAIALQMAEGIEAAHEKGVVHRDLKPANVKVTADGAVKVLDFGLAKAIEGDTAQNESGAMANSPTMARPMTDAGMILGTAAYMSPEQARGKTVDKRSDIWSFGVVLYEMLTGKRLFRGETVSDILAAVLREEVDLSALPAATPQSVRRVLERSLRRDPKQRLRDIGEVRLTLLDDSSPAPASTPRAAAPRRTAASLAAIVILAASLISLAAWTLLHRPTQQPLTRLTITIPPGQILAGVAGPAISRDGRNIAYVARDQSGISRLYVRQLDRFEATVIPESDGAQQPFFSPDGTKVGFFANSKLKTAAISGDAPISIADAAFQTYGATWGEDDTIVFAPSSNGLFRVPSSGGKPERLTSPDGKEAGYSHVFPQFLPDGKRVLFTIWAGVDVAARGASLLSLDTGKWTSVYSGPAVSRYVLPGDLLVSGYRGVKAAAFDLNHPKRVVASTFIATDVFMTPAVDISWFAVAENGTLAYVPGIPNLGILSWVDREGHVTPVGDSAEAFSNLTLSPDGTRAVVEDRDDILWVMDLNRKSRTRLTSDNENNNAYTVWSPDGKEVIFGSNRAGDWDIYSEPAGGGPARRLLQRRGNQFPLSVAPDGTILFSERWEGTGADLMTLSPSGVATPLLVSRFSKVGGSFSPDGRTIAYVSDETGRNEVYVLPFGRPGSAVAVSTDGGDSPTWSPDGREVFYRRGNNFLAASVNAADSLTVGDSKKMFEIQAASGRSANHAGYSVSPDGKRFLVQVLDPRAIPTQINIVLNWSQELKAKVPQP